MLNKDLLYALQTRSKKMIRELDSFTNNIQSVSDQDGWTLFVETTKLVLELGPTHDKYSHVIKAVNRAWLAFADRSDEAAEELYRYVIESLEKTDWTHEGEAQAAYQLLYAFHANHLRFPGANAHLRHGLRQHSSRIFSLIQNIVPYSTQTLFSAPVKPHNGTGTDAIGMLLNVYVYHAGLCGDDDLRAEAAQMLPLLVRANPQTGSGLIFSLLRDHPQRADIVCQLIELYLGVSERERSGGMFFHIMLELLDNDGASFVYDDLDKITSHLATSSARWTSSQLDQFAHCAFFYRLDNEEKRRLLLSKSAKARRLARMVIDSAHSGTYIEALRSLHNSAGEEKPMAPRLSGARQFEDLNFKLLVIQELMYVQETLLPRFDVNEFIRQYTGREIMIKKEGYVVIPEVLKYFEMLEIPLQLLAQVEELSFDGSNEIYHQVVPYWDGECDTFGVASVADIGLLPNLKRMSCMPDRFVERHAKTLMQKAIEIG